jgi:carbonic anhydrase
VSFATLLVLAVAVSCGPGAGPPAEPGAETGHAADGTAPWGYEGETGPENWAELSPDFALCLDGREQSPIDLSGATVVEGPAFERLVGETVLTVEQRATVMDIVDNGHTIQVTNDVPMALDVEGVHYELVQYHFHAPSEHTIDGGYAPLEVHFVHKSAGGQLAVIGVLFEEGEHDPIWDPVLSALPSGPDDPRHVENLELDLDEFRPLPSRYFAYNGSLTTPPCSEGVEWIVMAGMRQLSPDQMARITSHLHRNNRPVQPLGDRELLLVSTK